MVRNSQGQRARTAFAALAMAICLAGPAAAENGKPDFYEMPIASMKACHAHLDKVEGDWRTDKAFTLKKLSDGRERLLHCLPDGLVEWVCDPAGGRVTAAVMVGATSKACAVHAPGVPTTVKGPMIP